MIARPFVTRKIKDLVLFDRPADGAAVLVVDQLRFVAGIQGGIVEHHGPRLQVLVGVIFKRRSMHLVRSALGLDVDGGATRQALLGVETVRDNVDLLDRFEGRDVGDHMRELDMRGTDAVDARVVLVVACSIDRELQRPRRVGRDRVRIRRRRDAGQQSKNLLVVPAQRHRKILQFIGGDRNVHLRRVCLQGRRLRRHRDRFVRCADLQGNIHSRHVVEADGNVRLVEGLEARLADVQVVGPGRKVGKPVTTRLIGDGLASQVGSLVGNGDGGPRDGRTACVPDVPYDRAIEYLRFSVVWHHQRQDQGYTYRTIQHHPIPHC